MTAMPITVNTAFGWDPLGPNSKTVSTAALMTTIAVGSSGDCGLPGTVEPGLMRSSYRDRLAVRLRRTRLFDVRAELRLEALDDRR